MRRTGLKSPLTTKKSMKTKCLTMFDRQDILHFFLRIIQRLQICKIPKLRIGTLTWIHIYIYCYLVLRPPVGNICD